MFNNDFLMHLGRMCNAQPGCYKCPIFHELDDWYLCNPEAWMELGIDVANIVEKWATDHPVITNKEKFEEVFGVDFPEGTNTNCIQLTQTWLNAEYKKPEKREAKDEKA